MTHVVVPVTCLQDREQKVVGPIPFEDDPIGWETERELAAIAPRRLWQPVRGAGPERHANPEPRPFQLELDAADL